MATLQGKAVKNTYRQVLQIGANNVGVSGTLQPVQDGGGINTALSLSTTAATVTGDLTITGDLIITGGGIQIQDLIDDTVASLIQNGTGITWAYNDTLRTLTPTITIATADGGAQADYFQFNVNANEASAVGKLKWNTTDGTMDIGLMGGNVVLQVGQEEVARVLNNSGTTLQEAAYQVVKITSAQGQRLAVGLAQGNNEANSKDTLGLVTETIANNQEGFVTTSGLVREIDTTGDLQSEVWVDGDTLYLSATTPGAITKVAPVAPNHAVIVGIVVYAHKIHGKIFVKVDNGYSLKDLHDVKITNVANNNILKYNSSLAVWENVAGTTTNISEGTNLYYTQARFDSAFAAKTTTNLAEGTNLYFTTARGDANFATNFATKTTTNLPEGTNLYFTNARSRGALSVTAGTGISYNSSTGNFELASIPNASLTNSSVTINTKSLALGGSLTLTTSDIAEGTNLYWTNARFDSRFSTKTTTDLAEGTNLYYTQTRFNTAFAAKSTTDLTEGTNLYYTDARARAAISENAVGLDYSNTSGVLSLTSGYAIPTTVKLGQYDTAYNRSIVSAAVTGTSTKTLTLTEQDANTITATWTDQGITTINGTANQIAASTVGNTTTVGFTNDVTFPNNVVVSGNLTINGTATYVNTQSVSTKDPLIAVANANTSSDAVDIGLYGEYYDTTDLRIEYTGIFRDASDAGKFKIFSGLVDEPTNVVNTSGTGYTVATLVANVEGDLAGNAGSATVLQTSRSISATGDAAWSVNFNGSANATAALTLVNTGVTASTYGTTTAVPTIAIDSKGRITSASNTNIAFPVTTVNSQSGTVVLTTSNIAEGTNQYFTSARAQAAISGTAPISVASGVVSITESSTIANGYLSSTNFNIFNNKQDAITGAATTIASSNLTASRALIANSSGKVATSATTDIELGYLAGVTSAIQTQLNTKALDSNTVHISGTETITGAKTFSSSVGIGATAGTNGLFEVSNLGAGVTVGDFLVDAANKNVYVGRLSSTSNDNTNFIVRNRIGTELFKVTGNTGAAEFSSSVLAKTFSTRNVVNPPSTGVTQGVSIGFDANPEWGWIQSSRNSSSAGELRDLFIQPLGGRTAFGAAQTIIFTAAGAATFAGNLTIEKVTPGLVLNGTPFGSSGAYINLQGWASGNKNWQLAVGTTGGAGLELITSTTAGGTSFGTVVGRFADATGIYTPVSDVNKKKDFEVSTIGLKEVLQLRPTLYRMKSEDESAPKELGFIAQEVKDFIPQAYVEGGDEDNKFIGLNFNAITAVNTKAIQELKQEKDFEILELKAQIEELKALIAAK